MSRFRFVDDHRDVYDVKRLCDLVEVSRSGYYAWRSRPPSLSFLKERLMSTVLLGEERRFRRLRRRLLGLGFPRG